MIKDLETLKQIAKELNSQRDKTYGGFANNADYTMSFFNANNREIFKYLKKDISGMQRDCIKFLIFMIGAKMARLYFNESHEDSYNDLFGYLEIFKSECEVRFKFKSISPKQESIIEIINEYLNS